LEAKPPGREPPTPKKGTGSRYAEEFKAELVQLAYPAGGEGGDLRVHRGLLQHRRRHSALEYLSPAEFE
jgi:hypothetical protein